MDAQPAIFSRGLSRLLDQQQDNNCGRKTLEGTRRRDLVMNALR
jgi:hypothetical protein